MKCPTDGMELKPSPKGLLVCPDGHCWKRGRGGRLARVRQRDLTPNEREAKAREREGRDA